MSAPEVATPASASMSLGDLVSPAAFVEEKVFCCCSLSNPPPSSCFHFQANKTNLAPQLRPQDGFIPMTLSLHAFLPQLNIRHFAFMTEEVAQPVVATPEETTVKKPKKTPAKKGKTVTVEENGENDEVASGDAKVETPVKAKKTPGPKKAAVKKGKTVTENGENDETTSGDAEVETPVKGAKKTRAKKTPVKKENETPKEDAASKEGEDNAEVDQPTTPKAIPKKRGPNKKKADTTPAGAKNEDDDVDMTTPATKGTAKTLASKPSTKKRASASEADGETPTKKSKAAANGTPAKRAVTKFPECWAEFSEEDKIIVTMKQAKSSWKAIEDAWTAITGTKPGDSVLRKRFAKLELVAQDFEDKDTARLVAAKKLVEADFIAIKQKMEKEQAAAIKKLETEKWAMIAEKIKDAGGANYTAVLILEKKYNALEKDGDINTDGDYTGSVAQDEDTVDEKAIDEEVVYEEAVDEDAVDEAMENSSVDDEEAPATNGNGHIEEEEVKGEVMEE
ncbi:hypothetical protein WAI453_003352 [Rhynchosporium graminicola]